jgi:hypothetical protein
MADSRHPSAVSDGTGAGAHPRLGISKVDGMPKPGGGEKQPKSTESTPMEGYPSPGKGEKQPSAPSTVDKYPSPGFAEGWTSS